MLPLDELDKTFDVRNNIAKKKKKIEIGWVKLFEILYFRIIKN